MLDAFLVHWLEAWTAIFGWQHFLDELVAILNKLATSLLSICPHEAAHGAIVG